MKVGLIGCGRWGKKILGYLKDHPNISGVHISHYPDTNDEILFNKEIHKAFVATPIETHYEIVKKALLLGKDVMCEKDLTPSLQATNDLIRISKLNRRQLFVDYIYSFNPNLPRDVLQFDTFKIVMEKDCRRIEDVATILGSHALAIAHNIVDLSRYQLGSLIDYRGISYPRKSLIITLYSRVNRDIEIQISTEAAIEEQFLMLDDQRFELDYPDGIRVMIDRFLTGESNYDQIYEVARIIQATRR